MENIIITESDGRRKNIGWIRDGVFKREVKRSKHMYKKLSAWGMDAETLNKLKDEITEIRFLDREKNILYTTTPQAMLAKGQYLHHKPHRAQVFLPLFEWKQEPHGT